MTGAHGRTKNVFCGGRFSPASVEMEKKNTNGSIKFLEIFLQTQGLSAAQRQTGALPPRGEQVLGNSTHLEGPSWKGIFHSKVMG